MVVRNEPGNRDRCGREYRPGNLAQCPASSQNAPFRSAYGNLQHFRHCFVGQAFEISKNQRSAIAPRNLTKRLLHGLMGFALCQPVKR